MHINLTAQTLLFKQPLTLFDHKLLMWAFKHTAGSLISAVGVTTATFIRRQDILDNQAWKQTYVKYISTRIHTKTMQWDSHKSLFSYQSQRSCSWCQWRARVSVVLQHCHRVDKLQYCSQLQLNPWEDDHNGVNYLAKITSQVQILIIACVGILRPNVNCYWWPELSLNWSNNVIRDSRLICSFI